MSKRKRLNLGVLVSGSGTNLQSIIDSSESGWLDATVRVVISDRPDAYALERAKKHGIETVLIERKSFEKKREFEEEIVESLNKHEVDLVCLAGFMRIIGNTLLAAYPNRIMNIHPALLPSFPGLEAQKQAFDYGVKISGCTVHFIDDEVDHGPIILQAPVPVLKDDTAETLQKRILGEEHRIFPEAIQLLAEERLKIDKRRVYIESKNE